MKIAFCLSVAVPLYKIALSQYCFPACYYNRFLALLAAFIVLFLIMECVEAFFSHFYLTQQPESTFKILNMILLHPCLKSFSGILLFLEYDPLGFVFAIKT